MPFEVHQTDILNQTTPLKKVLNARDWPGLRTYWKERRFVVRKGFYETWFRITDDYTYLDPLGKIGRAFDLFVLLSGLTPNSQEATWEFYAIAHEPEQETRAHSKDAKVVSPAAFSIAKSAMSLTKLLELHNVSYEDTGHGTIRFMFYPQGRRETFVSYPNGAEFHMQGVQSQRLTSYDLWRLLNDILNDMQDDRSAFIEYVSQRVDDETAAKLAA
jgi:hypothetical protein